MSGHAALGADERLNQGRSAEGKPPVDPRRVPCPACGAKPGDECRDMATKATLFEGHTSRRFKAWKDFGAAG